MLSHQVKQFLRKAVFYLNPVNITIGLLTGALDVYVSIHTDSGLALAVYSSVATSFMVGSAYYFTYANTAPVSPDEPLLKKQHTTHSKLLLALSGVCAPGIVINSFYGEYTGNTLLLNALDTKHQHEGLIKASSLAFAISFALGTSINALLMLDNLVEHLKKVRGGELAPLIEDGRTNTSTTSSLQATSSLRKQGSHSLCNPRKIPACAGMTSSAEMTTSARMATNKSRSNSL